VIGGPGFPVMQQLASNPRQGAEGTEASRGHEPNRRRSPSGGVALLLEVLQWRHREIVGSVTPDALAAENLAAHVRAPEIMQRRAEES